MDVREYIESGILELYVAGLLTENKNREVAEYANTYPEIKAEILAIEAAILALSRKAAPAFKPSFETFSKTLGEKDKGIISMVEPRNNRWTYIGWAASFVLAVGLTYMFLENRQLTLKIQEFESDMMLMEQQIADAENSLENTEMLLNTIRDKNMVVVPLGGQTVSPDSYAKAYWNKDKSQLFIDAKGLPAPPEGMEYQVWSLKLDPLSPTSLGLLKDFADDDNGIFALNNPNESQAFGITLEPAGGSESPTLEQLYVLGKVSS